MMRSVFLVAAAALSAACAPPLPHTIAVDGRFDAPTAAMVVDAADQWCSATGGRGAAGAWCPRVVIGSAPDAMPVVAATAEEYARHGRAEWSAAFNDNNEAVVVNMGRQLSPELLHDTMLHELGHCGIDGHLPARHGVLMRRANCEVRLAPDGTCPTGMLAPMACVDRASAREFCDQQGIGRAQCAGSCEQ